MISNKVTSHQQRSRSVLCILIPIVLGACGSNAPNEKVDAGKRRYCDAACLDIPVDQASEAGGNRDTQNTIPGLLDADLDDTARLDSPQDRTVSEARFNDVGTLVDSGFGDGAVDGAGGGFVDTAGDTADGGGKEATPEVGPESGPETRDVPAGDSADGKLEVADVRSDGTDLPPPDLPPEAPQDTPDVPDAPPAVCSIGTGQGSWAKGWTGQNPPALLGMATALDTLWTTGQISADFDFGSGAVAYGTGTQPTGFVAKLDPGTGLATAAWGLGHPNAADTHAPQLIAVAGTVSGGSGGGNVGIAGSFKGEMDFTANNSDTGLLGVDYLTSSTSTPFYAVLDGTSSGAYLTPKKIHIVNLGNGVLFAMASHPAQNAFVICGKTSIVVPNWSESVSNKGIIRNPQFLDAGVGTFGGGNTDLVVAKIDGTTGAVIWGRQYGGAGDQNCESAALDADGNVIIAGNYNGDLFQLDNVADTTGTVARLFLAKLNAAEGTLLSAVGFPAVGDAGISHAYALTVDGGGNIVMGGAIANSVDFRGGHVASWTGHSDAFVAKFDSSFNSVWVKSDGDAGYDQFVKSVAVSSSGDVFIGGNFQGNLPFLGLGDSTHFGALDAFAAQFASGNGSLVCAHAYGDAPGPQQITGISVARTATGPLLDSVFVGGKFRSTIKLGDTTFAWPGNSCTSIDAGDNSGCISGAACRAGICVNDSLDDYFIARLAP